MNVPLLDLKLQYKSLKDEIKTALDEVLESQVMIGGKYVSLLEEIVAPYCDCKSAVGMSSGTDALIAALMALGIYRSPLSTAEADEVIVPSFTFFATAGCVWRVGAKPVFADIDYETFNIDVKDIERKITPKTKAIIPVHLFGQCANMKAIMDLAKKHNLHVIEDACQSIGATQNGVKAGALGDCGALSFFPTKNLGGLGDGGMAVTKDKALGDYLKIIRNHGMEPKYFHKMVGGNFRLDALQAAGLCVKMKYLESWHEGRRRNAKFYDEALKSVSEIVTPKIADGNVSVYNQYVVRVPRRDECIAFLKEQGVNCEIYYPMALHNQECFQALGYNEGSLPESERAAKEVLALPIFPELEEAQLAHVVESIKNFLSKK